MQVFISFNLTKPMFDHFDHFPSPSVVGFSPRAMVHLLWRWFPTQGPVRDR